MMCWSLLLNRPFSARWLCRKVGHDHLYSNISGVRPLYKCVAEIFIWYSKRQEKLRTRTASPRSLMSLSAVLIPREPSLMADANWLPPQRPLANRPARKFGPQYFQLALCAAHCSRPAPQVLETRAPLTSMLVGVVLPLLMPHSSATCVWITCSCAA